MSEPTAIYYHNLAQRHANELASLKARVEQVMELDPGDYCCAEAILISGIQETLMPKTKREEI